MAPPQPVPEPQSTEPSATEAPAPAVTGFRKKTLAWIAGITILVWAFAINTGSTVLMIIVGVLTLLLIAVMAWAFHMIRKQRGLANLLAGATSSTDARRDALAKIAGGKDANSPTNLFVRAQLMASDEPKAALALVESIALREFPPAMQDDVSLLKTQLYLGSGRTADARKSADSINLDNPARAEVRPLAATIVAEAWARTGKPKDALALLDGIELPKKDREQLELQGRIARVFARFAAGQRGVARTQLIALADEDLNHLGRFLLPQFRVHPQLAQLARQVLEQHPSRKKFTAKRRA